jgi:hypothetical protein
MLNEAARSRLVPPPIKVVCQFCSIGDRSSYGLEEFQHHLQSHRIDSSLLVTVMAFQEECYLLLPFSPDCPFETCADQFSNPSDVDFGEHIRSIHSTVDILFEKRMRGGEYFWWMANKTGNEGLSHKPIVSLSNMSQVQSPLHFRSPTCTRRR